VRSAQQSYPQTDWGTPSRIGQRSQSDLRNLNGNENGSSLSKRLWGGPPTSAPVGDAPRPVNPHGSFLAALVAAGYGNLSVDEIIALKDHGIDARFLADFIQSGWEKMAARDLIEMHDHGVPAEMLRALRDAGFQHLEIDKVVNAYEQGVRPGTLKEATQYGMHLTLPQIVRLKQAGVIP
jgi:hypothetical protein